MYQLLTARKTMPADIPLRSDVKIEEVIMNSGFFDDDEKDMVQTILYNMIAIGCIERHLGDTLTSGVRIESNVLPSNICETAQMITDLGVPIDLVEPLTPHVKHWFELLDGQQFSREQVIRRSRALDTEYADSEDGCQWPGCDKTDELVKDHNYPYALGGGRGDDNLRYLCTWHNLIKSCNPYFVLR
jgi:hypothetical protein